MLKVAVIGGGSTYTPELIQGFLDRRAAFPLDELWLMDPDADRLRIVGGFAQRLAAAQGAPFAIHLTTDQHAAVAGARYVITQLRVGQMAARREDEYLGRRHGLIGQETTGLGGFAKALRTIPVILQIARAMADTAAPGALLVNFTNPAGLITQALSQSGAAPAVGVCNIPLTTKMTLAARLEKLTGRAVDPARAELRSLGLNHLTWHTGFTVDGEEVWPELFAAILADLRAQAEPEWEPRLLEVLRMIPNPYLQYFYQTERKLAAQAHWPPSRAEAVLAVEADLLRQYAEPDRREPPADLMKRGGAYYSTAATQLLNAHYNDLNETHIVNVRQAGAVAEWPAEWVLEMPATVGRAGIRPRPTPALPPVCFGLLAQVKAYELLTVEAAIHGDREAAYQALLAHPLGPAADQVPAVLDDLLATHRPYLPQFWGRPAG